MNFKKLQDQLIRHEGIKRKPYVDTVGKVTIGVGHNLTDDGLTASQVLSILNDDMTETVSILNVNCPWFRSLDDVRQRAIADLTFNVKDKIRDFKHMIAAIEVKDWNKASDELLNSTFATQTGQRAKDLAYMLKTGLDPKA